jgi:hypothetical protein
MTICKIYVCDGQKIYVIFVVEKSVKDILLASKLIFIPIISEPSILSLLPVDSLTFCKDI